MDSIAAVGKSTIQHGDENSRVYIMKLYKEDIDEVLRESDRLSEKNGYGKIVAKVPESMAGKFSISGFRLEATVPGFYHGREQGLFMGKFLDDKRSESSDIDEITIILDIAKSKESDSEEKYIEAGYTLRQCTAEDSSDMANLYGEVFASYPFPIFDPEYIKSTMEENLCYYGVWHRDRLVALSSSEMDELNQNTEMTDFATDPSYRGKSLSQILLRRMESDMAKRGIKTAYTIARAKVTGINIVFSKAGYNYAGTLINNTNIDGSIESMNIWYKSL